jgi:hypothetical protein
MALCVVAAATMALCESIKLMRGCRVLSVCVIQRCSCGAGACLLRLAHLQRAVAVGG